MDVDTAIILILTISNLFEIAYLIKSSKKTEQNIDRAVNDPEFIGEAFKNAFVGMSKALREDEEAQKEFFGLCAVIGQAALSQAADVTTKQMEKLAKKAAPAMPKGWEWAAPLIQQFIPKAKEQAVDAVVETVGANW